MKKRIFCLILLSLVFTAVNAMADAESSILADQNRLTEANTAFALDLYKELSQKTGNVLFSPYSISAALAMTLAGAKGDTATEMFTTLHFKSLAGAVNNSFSALTAALSQEQSDSGNELRIANAIWPDIKHVFLEEYLNLLAEDYQAASQQLDYGRPEESRRVINNWIAENTSGKIKELLKAGSLSEAVRLVLTNAVYFKGLWQTPFEESRTRQAPFQLLSGNEISVMTMRLEDEFEYGELGDVKVLKLPYQKAELSMLLVLPNEKDGLPGLEERFLTASSFKTWSDSLRKQKVRVSLPRFSFSSSYEMRQVLSSLGIRKAFSREADFSGMDGSRSLFIDQVVHQAVIEVNEEGSEAAAATGVIMALKSMVITPTFNADHPFLFFILHEDTGAVLFMGRVVKPE